MAPGLALWPVLVPARLTPVHILSSTLLHHRVPALHFNKVDEAMGTSCSPHVPLRGSWTPTRAGGMQARNAVV